MATIANWNGHTFVVSPSLIRGFTDLSIKGSCETTEKNTAKQKYVEHKYGEIPEISMTVSLNAQTGVTDVYREAMEFVQEATDGAAAYFYLGSSKLFPAKMMLTQAEITQIVHMPGQGNRWISCDVKVTFKQGTKNDGAADSGGGSGSGGGSKKQSVKASTPTSVIGAVVEGVGDAITRGLNYCKNLVSNAKNGSTTKKTGGLVQVSPEKQTTTGTDSAQKTSPTTGRSSGGTLQKIDRVDSGVGAARR